MRGFQIIFPNQKIPFRWKVIEYFILAAQRTDCAVWQRRQSVCMLKAMRCWTRRSTCKFIWKVLVVCARATMNNEKESFCVCREFIYIWRCSHVDGGEAIEVLVMYKVCICCWVQVRRKFGSLIVHVSKRERKRNFFMQMTLTFCENVINVVLFMFWYFIHVVIMLANAALNSA